MKWIKASERLPDKTGEYYIRQKPYRRYFSPASDFKSLEKMWIDNRYEWLDESTPPPPVQSDSDLDDIISKYVGNPSRLLRIDVEKTAVEYASLKTKELREALEDCDFLLAHFEDFTHGRDGYRVTQCRGKIQEALNPNQ